MKIRLIVIETNHATAANVGGPIEVRYRTFDVDAPAVVAFLGEPARFNDHYTERWISGVEVLPFTKCDGNHAGPRCADPECWNQ